MRHSNTEAAVKAAAEAHRKAKRKREAMGIFPATFMRLTLTEDAYAITKDMDGPTFRHFVSRAIRNAVRKTQAA